jgi:hypothetical protein
MHCGLMPSLFTKNWLEAEDKSTSSSFPSGLKFCWIVQHPRQFALVLGLEADLPLQTLFQGRGDALAQSILLFLPAGSLEINQYIFTFDPLIRSNVPVPTAAI